MLKHYLQFFPASVLFLLLFLIGYSTALAQDARLIAKNTFPSVVMLEMHDENNRPISLGSGFFVRPDIIATNYHVIEGASDGFAKIVGQKTIYHIEGLVGVDKAKDLALIKLTGVSGKPLTLADVSKIEVGQEIFALGNPKGLEGTISTGIISGSSLRKVENENLIQITAPISPGSSGGPVVNRKGEVIGVAVASLKDGQNLNFVVPSSYLALLIANSKHVMPFSNKNGAKEKQFSNAEPTIAETTSWIIEKLLAKGGSTSDNRIIERNEQIVFNDCEMTFTYSIKVRSLADYTTRVGNINTLEKLGLSDDGKTIVMIFSVDSFLGNHKLYENGILTKNEQFRSGGFHMWVGDEEMGLRVIKAFNQLKKLCKEATKSEPF